MTRRTILYITAGVLAGAIIAVGMVFALRWFDGYQTRRWREQTILASTGQTLPLGVLREIRCYGKIPLHQILALGHAESRGNPEAISEKGAVGWMQIMPRVAMKYGYTPEEMFDPVKCCYVGIRHYHEMLKAFDGDQRNAVAAYNNGIKGWKKCLNEKRVPSETRKLLSRYTLRSRIYGRFLREGVIE